MDWLRNLFGYNLTHAQYMTGFFALFVFCGVFHAFNARTMRINLLARLRHNPSFITVMLLVAAVQVALIYYGGTLFRTTSIPLESLRAAVLLGALVIPADVIRKIGLRAMGRTGVV